MERTIERRTGHNGLERYLAGEPGTRVGRGWHVSDELVMDLVREDRRPRMPQAPNGWIAAMAGDPEPATEGQIARLHRLGAYIPANLNKQEASVLLDGALERPAR